MPQSRDSAWNAFLDMGIGNPRVGGCCGARAGSTNPFFHPQSSRDPKRVYLGERKQIPSIDGCHYVGSVSYPLPYGPRHGAGGGGMATIRQQECEGTVLGHVHDTLTRC